jgi:hypothetical protein
MADDPKQEETNGPRKGLDDILRWVDSLPIVDPRSPDGMLSYDESGLPTRTEHAKWPDFAARAKELLGDRVFDDFLNYRHREWELTLAESTPSWRRHRG